ncbi:hypothetical protein [Streptomyces sp. NBC_00328]|uniref:hypothetical protein n=1 Tax=Streptomyces sp. NBC_00328 TaxID=2903646 RepID=UPI002E28F386|nr:hypothetical protein [Streptomyces sp. NBC_00328]
MDAAFVTGIGVRDAFKALKTLKGVDPAAVAAIEAEACAGLGYRLFLRAVKTYFVPVPADGETYGRFVALGERFGYPYWVVREGLNDRRTD